MSDAFDLIVVGGGPGGMTAAATAVEAGRRVCMVDDNPSLGGQIWRSKAGNQLRTALLRVGCGAFAMLAWCND